MSDLSINANNRRFIALDVFRVFIVTMVLLFHAVIHKFWHLSGDGFFFRNMITAAVYMYAFFILSGFVLYYRYGGKDKSFSPYAFYAKRLLKLYPSYLVFTAVVMLYDGSFDWQVMPAEMLCFQGFFKQIFPKYGNAGTWFISCIAFSYMLFPVLSRVISAHAGKVLLFSFAIIVYITVFSVFYRIDEMAVYINPMYRIWEFTIGGCLAAIFIRRETKTERKRSAVIHALGAGAAFTGLFVAVAVLYKNNFVNHVDFARHYIFYACVTVPLFAAIIYMLAALGDCRVKNPFWLRTSAFLSAMTFPFFLWQGLAERLTRDYGCIRSLTGFIAVNLLLAVISHLIFNRLAAVVGKKMKGDASS